MQINFDELTGHTDSQIATAAIQEAKRLDAIANNMRPLKPLMADWYSKRAAKMLKIAAIYRG